MRRNLFVSMPPLVVLLLSFSFLPCASQPDNAPLRARNFPHFHVDAARLRSPGGDNYVELYYEVSYSQLQFLKEGRVFVARFEVQAVLYDGKRRQVAGDWWRRRVECDTYRETISPERSYSETFRLTAPPGKYELFVRTEHLDSDKKSSVLTRLDLSEPGILPSLSDLIVGTCTPDSSSDLSPRGRVKVHPRGRFGERYPYMCVYGEVYDSPVDGDTVDYRMHGRILDEQGTVRMQDTIRVRRTRDLSPFVWSPSLDELTMGRYTLEMQLGENKGAVKVTKTFEVDETRFDLDEDIDDTVHLLSYIASRSELDVLKEARGEDRRRVWLEFWRKRDPYPETPENEFLIEFFERVRYANDNFSYFEPGWRTDRGRVYIRRGPPDQVETRPMNPSGPAYEVWYYFEEALTFVFVDRTGLGQYELVGPSYE